MTFNEFCANYGVNEEERARLLDYLAFMKFRSFLEWWDGMR